MSRLLRCSRGAGAVSLAGLSALHALWANGSAWPAPDRATLARAIGGFSEVPSAPACLAVAALLGVAAVCVAGLPPPFARVARCGAAGTSLVLAARGGVGLAGAMPHAGRSQTFARLDRRFYSPLCLALALAAAAGCVPA
ncbi:MAG: DUF3995 domain-containing protein [Candidatus Eremiobacteraeota bacterium]|nr:DUF3995 domain-containing protein [Candidatus Eremiobacteraeota bacterium]